MRNSDAIMKMMLERQDLWKKKIVDDLWWDNVVYTLSFTQPICNTLRLADTSLISIWFMRLWFNATKSEWRKL